MSLEVNTPVGSGSYHALRFVAILSAHAALIYLMVPVAPNPKDIKPAVNVELLHPAEEIRGPHPLVQPSPENLTDAEQSKMESTAQQEFEAVGNEIDTVVPMPLPDRKTTAMDPSPSGESTSKDPEPASEVANQISSVSPQAVGDVRPPIQDATQTLSEQTKNPAIEVPQQTNADLPEADHAEAMERDDEVLQQTDKSEVPGSKTTPSVYTKAKPEPVLRSRANANNTNKSSNAPRPSNPKKPQKTPAAAVGKGKSGNYADIVRRTIRSRMFYPKSAKSRGVAGRVTFSFTIGSAGSVVAFKVIRSSGSSDLDSAAKIIVTTARFPPPPGGKLNASSTLVFE